MATSRMPMPAATRPRLPATHRARALLLALAAALQATLAGPARAADPLADTGQLLWYFDSRQGHIGFEIAALGVLGFKGHFQRFGGGVFVDPADGQARVLLAIDATSLTMNRNRYQDLARSADFFAINEYPRIGFISEPFPALQPLRQLHGTLHLRGHTGAVAFVLASTPCTDRWRPCTVHAHGELDRRAFGMTAWRSTVSSRVGLQIRLQADPAQPAPATTGSD